LEAPFDRRPTTVATFYMSPFPTMFLETAQWTTKVTPFSWNPAKAIKKYLKELLHFIYFFIHLFNGQ
jgi:hypothetical protein